MLLPPLVSRGRHVPRPFLYTPAWRVCGSKYLAVVLGVIIVLVVPITLVHFTASVGPPRESLAETVERLGLCSHWSEHYPNTTMSADVQTICDDLNATHVNYFRLQDERVNPFQHGFILPAVHVCDQDTEAVILIHTLHTYTDKRTALRRTWAGATLNNTWPTGSVGINVKVAFVLGVHGNQTWNDLLLAESAKHRDIVQGDFYDSYRNLTLKSLLGIKWVLDYCPGVRYLIKSDDDTIVNVPALVRVLVRHNMTHAIMGSFKPKSRVLRSGKWGLTHEEFPFRYFPQYETGGAYVISGDLLSPLFHAAEYVPPIFIDDVYITGILGEILHVRHVEQGGFSVGKKPSACEIQTNSVLTGQNLNPRYIEEIWQNLTSRQVCNVDKKRVLVLT